MILESVPIKHDICVDIYLCIYPASVEMSVLGECLQALSRTLTPSKLVAGFSYTAMIMLTISEIFHFIS